MRNLRITATEDGQAVVVALVGELDMAEAANLAERLRQIERESPELVVIDLSALTFIDSTGLRELIDAERRARETGRRFALVPGPDPIQEIFRVTLLDLRFDWVEPRTLRLRQRSATA